MHHKFTQFILIAVLSFSTVAFSATVTTETTPGSFLVVLNADTFNTLSANQLLKEGLSVNQRKEIVKLKEQQFQQAHAAVSPSLLATPGMKSVASYPALMSYVIYVKDTAAAQLYLDKLAQNPAIANIGRFYGAQPELDVSGSATLLRTNENPVGDNWWLGDTFLTPVTVGILDDGVNTDHPMFVSPDRHFACQPDADPEAPTCGKDLPSAHGTSMTSIYASRFPVHPGLTSLPASLHGGEDVRRVGPVKNFLIAKAGAETAEGRPVSAHGLLWLLTQTENHKVFPDIINYSQGNGAICLAGEECEPLAYSPFAALIDTVIDDLGVSFIKSAGNNGYNADNTTMTVPSDAFNLIAVANLNPFDWDRCTVRGGDRNHFKIHLSSSVSPTYEQLENNTARRLLTVAAPGRSINVSGLNPKYCMADCAAGDEACRTACLTLGDVVPGYDPREYGFWRKSTGTSPAAPMVGSVAALLHASGVKHPAAIKAVIANSASSWTSSDSANPIAPEADANGDMHCDTEEATLHHPTKGTPLEGAYYDRTYAWGVLDASTAYKQHEYVFMDKIEKGEVKEYFGTLKDFEKVTLVWQKHLGKKLTQLNLKLHYKKDNKWVLLMKDTTIHNNVKQVSNGKFKIKPVDAKEFRLTVSAVGSVPHGGETFAIAPTREFN
jgi:serine protease AprX